MRKATLVSHAWGFMKGRKHRKLSLSDWLFLYCCRMQVLPSKCLSSKSQLVVSIALSQDYLSFFTVNTTRHLWTVRQLRFSPWNFKPTGYECSKISSFYAVFKYFGNGYSPCNWSFASCTLSNCPSESLNLLYLFFPSKNLIRKKTSKISLKILKQIGNIQYWNIAGTSKMSITHSIQEHK